MIQVTGKFGTSEFSRTDGTKGYSLKITVLAWNYIPGTNGQKDANSSNGANGENAQAPVQNTEESPPEGYVSMTMNLDDDDLPF
jgi:single-stranded DNA-binding protein